jgi:hypothetical protein
MKFADYTQEQFAWEERKGWHGRRKFFPDDAPMVSVPRPIAVRALILADIAAFADAADAGITPELLKETIHEINKALAGGKNGNP